MLKRTHMHNRRRAALGPWLPMKSLPVDVDLLLGEQDSGQDRRICCYKSSPYITNPDTPWKRPGARCAAVLQRSSQRQLGRATVKWIRDGVDSKASM